MKLRDTILILKYFLNIFNGIFLVLGFLLMTFGIWLLFDRDHLFAVLSFTGENHLVTYISFMLVGVGSIIGFISFFGFLGSFKEIRWLLILYLGLITLLLGLQAAIPVLIYLRKEELECCGRHNSTDWKKNENKEHADQVPCSCIKSNRKEWFCDAPGNEVYSKGCDEYINVWFENNTLALIIINIALLTIEVLLFILSVLLFKNIKKNKISLMES
nr:putative tetraspanin-19 isoform X3 [Pelodiscus sinensis]|eukprot:XP_025035947.1 putative tetraspanin-19 isoform X3 [Pelodiscus sinensis]